MRIGYMIDSYHPAREREAIADSMDAMIDEGVAAERAGFHSVVAPDRHRAPECRFPGPEQMLTMLARETERVALGTFTFIGTLVHPMRSVEQFSLIDNLSRGRLFTTVSRGFLSEFWGQYGIPEERLLGRYLEGLRIWRQAFGGESFDFDGVHWQVRNGRLAPVPYQPDGWPIWGGGNASVAGARRAAEEAECWTCDPLPVPDEIWEERVGAYRERALELGKRPFVVAMQDGWVADSFEEAAEEFGQHFLPSARFYVRRGLLKHPDFPTEADVTAKRLAPYLVLGTPQDCVERLVDLHERRGVDYVILCCRVSTGPSLERTREQIQRLGEEVVAPIHARYPAPDHPAIPAGCRGR
jgi:alkanesulfonate monooxygenase SsuD/methylene tetrahydromethanopterin reductase-like flavin-dependent oxidoreductase (luciferase family)